MSFPDCPKTNHIRIDQDQVVKVFARGNNRATRFRREIKALRRLSGIEGIPTLLSYSPSQRRVTLERIPGTALSAAESVPDKAFLHLRLLVADMLYCGVARHSLPARDVIIRPDGSVGLVDFERCSFRYFSPNPIWRIASEVAHFNLLLLMDNHAPHLLTAVEREVLIKRYKWKDRFHILKHWIDQNH